MGISLFGQVILKDIKQNKYKNFGKINKGM